MLRKKWLTWPLYLIAALAGTILIAAAALHQSLPAGTTGPAADALARKMMKAIDHDAWIRTGVVEWNFAGREKLLWDRQRHYVRFEKGEKKVLVDISGRRGVVLCGAEDVPMDEQSAIVKTAWERWANDSFWLNPVSKSFDDGASRRLVDLPDGGKGLLVTFASGGVTPGDSYLWQVDASGQPVSWKMWVNMIPIGGIFTSWEDWITLETGARIATTHRLPIFTLKLSEIRSAATLAELYPDEDPFSLLGQGRSLSF